MPCSLRVPSPPPSPPPSPLCQAGLEDEDGGGRGGGVARGLQGTNPAPSHARSLARSSAPAEASDGVSGGGARRVPPVAAVARSSGTLGAPLNGDRRRGCPLEVRLSPGSTAREGRGECARIPGDRGGRGRETIK